jgi:hypothetical protein
MEKAISERFAYTSIRKTAEDEKDSEVRNPGVLT